MVKLTKIYTRTGDDGTTGLASGTRVRKDDPRVEAYGTVDEANAAVGLAVLAADAAAGSNPDAAAIAAMLRAIQHDLFDLGADLATPRTGDEPPGSRLRIIPSQTLRLEKSIDEHNEGLATLTSFVLPGGTALASALHLARTITRRAERAAVALQALDPAGVNPEAITYLNRLSDLLFVLSRVANDHGGNDVLWKPGANR
ncbi:MAG: cob(I)yrinic acid a,c-diamide adenosyltransferase [Phycisphaerae bacterium]|nr:MAG: cob(I)yrinic acid a,c-diamide adenosyltransferase [Phycisphaerae bacterium]